MSHKLYHKQAWSIHLIHFIGRSFVVLCYRTVVCLSVMLVYCGQTTGWIKMPLGPEVGLGPGNVVLDGDPSLPQKGGWHSPLPNFDPCLLWPSGWMDQDET